MGVIVGELYRENINIETVQDELLETNITFVHVVLVKSMGVASIQYVSSGWLMFYAVRVCQRYSC